MIQNLKVKRGGQGGTKSIAYLLLGNASADNQLSGRRGLDTKTWMVALARSHITVEKYNNEYRENILPLCNCGYQKTNTETKKNTL